MKMTRIVSAIAAASVGLASFAFAQEPPNDGRDAAANRLREQANRAQDNRQRGDMRQDNRRDVRQDDRRDVRQDSRRDDRRDNRRDERHDDRSGAGPDHSFYRGGRLPDQYRGRQYVVEDWRGHHLSAPPRGYHWVQTGGDYVLAAVATGIIASILINSR